MMSIFKRKNITLERALLFFTFFFFIVYTLFSYIGGSWYLKYTSASSLTQNANSGTFVKLLLFCALVCFLFLVVTQCLKQRLSPIIMISLTILTLFGVFWTGYSVLIDNVTILVLVRDPFPPITLLLPLAILIGIKDNLWKDIKKYIFICSIVLISASFISAIDFLKTYGTVYRPTASGMIYWFYKGFFLLYATILFTDEWKKKYKPIVFILIIMLFFISAILQARSWFIQTIIMFIVYMATAKNKRGYNILTILILCLIILILSATHEEIFTGLIKRFTTSGDTRSGQLEQFFEQVGLPNFLIGQGMTASYNFSNFKDFNYIDNQFLLSMFRYGIIPTILYMYLLIYPIVRSIDERNKVCLKQSFLIIVWIFAIFGLSVYFNLSFEIAGFVIFVMVGRIIGQLEKSRNLLWRGV